MKSYIFLSLTFLLVILAGCEYDNFEEPSSEITGEIIYNDEPIGVKSNEVELELWQSGYELDNDIPIYINQNGSFTTTVFDGRYQLVLREGNGPWVNNTDSIDVDLNGRAEVDVPVEPFYIIDDESIEYSDGSIEATFTVREINDSENLEFVGLYIGENTIVDQIYNEANSTQAGDEISFGSQSEASVSLSDRLSNRDYIFARVGLKVAGRSELLFTPVHKVEF